MPSLAIKLDGDNCWPDLKDEATGRAGAHVIVADNLQVAFLPGGMASGKAAILLRIDLPDGRVVITETSHALFDAAAAAFRGREAYLADLANQGGEAS